MEQAFGRPDSTGERKKGRRPNRLSRSLSVQYEVALLALMWQRNPTTSVITFILRWAIPPGAFEPACAMAERALHGQSELNRRMSPMAIYSQSLQTHDSI